ncbi:MAG: hypothetical protein NZZ41_04860 [Candidatus Dojkabacteria bacterium]|nr:hypothetical protein [Candidatus Dojkabacteria bacterium]
MSYLTVEELENTLIQMDNEKNYTLGSVIYDNRPINGVFFEETSEITSDHFPSFFLKPYKFFYHFQQILEEKPNLKPSLCGIWNNGFVEASYNKFLSYIQDEDLKRFLKFYKTIHTSSLIDFKEKCLLQNLFQHYFIFLDNNKKIKKLFSNNKNESSNFSFNLINYDLVHENWRIFDQNFSDSKNFDQNFSDSFHSSLKIILKYFLLEKYENKYILFLFGANEKIWNFLENLTTFTNEIINFLSIKNEIFQQIQNMNNNLQGILKYKEIVDEYLRKVNHLLWSNNVFYSTDQNFTKLSKKINKSKQKTYSPTQTSNVIASSILNQQNSLSNLNKQEINKLYEDLYNAHNLYKTITRFVYFVVQSRNYLWYFENVFPKTSYIYTYRNNNFEKIPIKEIYQKIDEVYNYINNLYYVDEKIFYI